MVRTYFAQEVCRANLLTRRIAIDFAQEEDHEKNKKNKCHLHPFFENLEAIGKWINVALIRSYLLQPPRPGSKL